MSDEAHFVCPSCRWEVVVFTSDSKKGVCLFCDKIYPLGKLLEVDGSPVQIVRLRLRDSKGVN